MKKYVSLLTLISVLSCYGQKPLKDFYLKRSLKQDGLQYTFTVLDTDKHGVWKYRKDRFYFWYKAQHVMSTQGNSSGTLLNGKFESFYPNNQLASKGQFEKGLKQGQWYYWRNDGTLLKSEHWSNGVQFGTQIYYDEQGREKQTRILRRGRSERKVTDSLIITKRNDVQLITVYDSIGNVKRVENRKHGNLNGTVKTYENGKLIETEKYKDGVLIEKPVKDEDAKTSDEDDAKPDSKFKTWFSNLFKKKDKSEEDDTSKKKDKPKREKKQKKNNSAEGDNISTTLDLTKNISAALDVRNNG